jgi:hypothetical protein
MCFRTSYARPAHGTSAMHAVCWRSDDPKKTKKGLFAHPPSPKSFKTKDFDLLRDLLAGSWLAGMGWPGPHLGLGECVEVCGVSCALCFLHPTSSPASRLFTRCPAGLAATAVRRRPYKQPGVALAF